MKMRKTRVINTVSVAALCVGMALPGFAKPPSSTETGFLPKVRPAAVAAQPPGFQNMVADPIRMNAQSLSFSFDTQKNLVSERPDKVPAKTAVPLPSDIDRAVHLALEPVLPLPVIDVRIDVARNSEDTLSDPVLEEVPEQYEETAVDLSQEVFVEYDAPVIEVPLETFDIEPSGFMQARKRYMDSVARKDPGAEEALEYARFLIGSMMVDEARSFLSGIERKKETEAVVAAYVRALMLIDGSADASEQLGFKWPENSLWHHLEAELDQGDVFGMHSVKPAAGRFAYQSVPIASHLTPVLFERAIRLRDAKLARLILNAAFETTDLPGSGKFLLMQGRLAALEGVDQSAFEFYAAAAKLGGEDAAKAKLALAEFALSNDKRKYLPQAKDILVEAVQEWRGNETALRLMAKLAEVAEEIPDLPVSLEVMHDIQTDFPNTPEARLAGFRIPVVLKSLSASLEKDDFSLDQSIVTLRRLEPRMSSHPGWVEVRHVLAKKLVDAGLYQAALAEYRELLRDVSNSETVPEGLAEIIGVEEVELFLTAGDSNAVLQRLQDIEEFTSSDLNDRVLLLALKVDKEGVLDEGFSKVLEGSGNPEIMIEFARAALRAQDMDLVADAFEAYASTAHSLSESDTANYIRAISLSGRRDRIGVSKISAGNDDFVALGKGISNPAPILTPLAEESAYTMLERADRVLSTMKDLEGAAD